MGSPVIDFEGRLGMSIEYDERREDDEEQGPGHVEPNEDPVPDETEETTQDDDEQGPGHVPA
jgi:hypothetical protein